MSWPERILWPDDAEWLRLVLVFAGLLVLVGLAEGMRALFKLTHEASRKFVHVAVGVAILFSPRIFLNPAPLVVLSIVFIVLNAIAIQKGWLVSIHGPLRRSFGTVYFPLALLILTVLFWSRSPELVVLSMFSFSIGDAAAALVGESYARARTFTLTRDKKSLEGSATMFVATIVSVAVGSTVVWPFQSIPWDFVLVMGVAVAALATAWEAISSYGLDNLSVPLSNAFVISVFLLPTTQTSISQLSLGISLALVVAAASFQFRFLTASGSVATGLLASVMFGVGGWKWSMPIVVFFLFSSLLSRIGKQFASDLETVFEKSSTRDHGQVAANGGIAGLLMLAQYAFPEMNFFPAYIGVIAAVTADTWGTEVGVMSRGRTFSLVTMKEVPRGSNGGVSLDGSAAAIAGALLISLLGYQWVGSTSMIVAGLAGGLIGMVADSVTGATLQARFQCTVCGRGTERTEHCGVHTEHVRGWRWLRNDGVNWVCAITGGIVAALMYQ